MGRYDDDRQRRARVAGAGVDLTELTGRFLLIGTGDFRKEVTFPCTFVEQPFPTFYLEMTNARFPEHGSFPRLESADVISWQTRDPDANRPSLRRGHFVGVHLALHVTGPGGADERLWLNYQFLGDALANPAVHRPTLEEPV